MNFEAKSEASPLTPEQEDELRAIAIARAPKELAEVEAADTDEKLFYALPDAALTAFHLEQYDLAKINRCFESAAGAAASLQARPNPARCASTKD